MATHIVARLSRDFFVGPAIHRVPHGPVFQSLRVVRMGPVRGEGHDLTPLKFNGPVLLGETQVPALIITIESHYDAHVSQF